MLPSVSLTADDTDDRHFWHELDFCLLNSMFCKLPHIAYNISMVILKNLV